MTEKTEIEKKETEVVKTKPSTPLDIFKADLFMSYGKTIQNSLGKQGQIKFMGSCSYLVQTVPKLLDVNRSSLLNAIMQSFELGLSIGPSGEFYVLPYGKVAQGQIGYKGIVKLLYGAGVQSIRSEIVYKNDEFNNINGIINHKIDIFKSSKERGEAVGCYVIAKVNGEEMSKGMNVEDIMKFREFSKGKGFDSSPWIEKNDPELNMWKKTVLKQLSKMLPQSEALVKAIEIDNKDSTIGDERINEMSSDEVVAKSLEGFGEAEEGENKNIS